jgi:hypothetical protein
MFSPVKIPAFSSNGEIVLERREYSKGRNAVAAILYFGPNRIRNVERLFQRERDA